MGWGGFDARFHTFGREAGSTDALPIVTLSIVRTIKVGLAEGPHFCSLTAAVRIPAKSYTTKTGFRKLFMKGFPEYLEGKNFFYSRLNFSLH